MKIPARLIFLSFLCLYGFRVSGQKDPVKDLGKFSAPLDINDDSDFTGFHMLDSVVTRYKVFFTGEFHEMPGNTQIQWKMFSYLHARTGLRTIVFEMPVSYCFLAQHYLDVNDSNAYFSLVENSMDFDDRVFFARIFTFNRELPPGKKIILRGIDYEKAFETSITALKFISKAHPDLKKKDPLMVRIDKMNYRIRDTALQNWARKVYWSVANDTSGYKNVLGNDFQTFRQVIAGIDCDSFVDAETSRRSLDLRETLLSENFTQLLRDHPREKIFGQFGETHTCLEPNSNWCQDMNWTSFIAKANTEKGSPVKDSILIFAYVYANNYYPGQYFPGLSSNDYVALESQFSWANFILFGPIKFATLEKPLEQKVQYLIFDNFSEKDAEDYYGNEVNDGSQVISNSGFYCSGFYFSLNAWRHFAIEAGFFSGYE